MKAIITILICAWAIGCAQPEYVAPIVTNMPVRTPSNLPQTALVVTSGTIMFIGENEVVLKPETPPVPAPVGDLDYNDDVYIIKTTGTNQFIGRIGMFLYAELKDLLDASYIQTLGSKLSFKYEEKYITNDNAGVSFQIYKFDRTPMLPTPIANSISPNKIVLGTNYYSIDLSLIAGMEHSTENSYYILEVTTSKGEITKLRFKYTYSD